MTARAVPSRRERAAPHDPGVTIRRVHVVALAAGITVISALVAAIAVPVRAVESVQLTIQQLTVAVSELKVTIGASNGSIAQMQTHLAQLDARENERDVNRDATQRRLQSIEDHIVQIAGSIPAPKK